MTTIIKVNKAKIRRDIARILADDFIASGATYTCAAAIYSVIRGAATIKAKELYDAGIFLSKSAYAFNVIDCTASMFLSDAAVLIYNHYYPVKN